MADVRVSGGLASGLRIIGWALLCYALSAFATAASAGLFAFAVATARVGDPVTGVLNASGSVGMLIGLPLAALALALLVWGFSEIQKEARRTGAETAPAVARALSVLWAAYGAFVAWGVLGSMAFLVKGASVLFTAPSALAGAAAAFLFMTAVLILALALSRRPGPSLAWSATVLGSVGITGETVLGLRFFSSIDGEFDWLTLGGFPLINWNLPFGVVVGVGSLLLWTAFRLVPTATLGVLSRGPAAPSQGPSP